MNGRLNLTLTEGVFPLSKKAKGLLNCLLPVGRRSLLFGVHQVIWHPFTVLLAWIKLYGLPSWQELVCIIIHDWGYWNCRDMDGQEGELHPRFAALLAGYWLGPEYHNLCLYHSRQYAQGAGRPPSQLCWADKMSIIYDPWWLYLPRAWVSGELQEYRKLAAAGGYIPLTVTHREWFRWIKDHLSTVANEQRGEISLLKSVDLELITRKL